MRALCSLQAGGAPLQGLDLRLDHIRYDWSRAGELVPILEGLGAKEAVVAVSSEGALFEYGSDQNIIANLEALGQGTPRGTFAVGSVTRDDPTTRRIHASGGAAVRPMGIDRFRRLLARTAWILDRVEEGAISDQVRILKNPAAL
jgi:hypothetical protein